MALLLSRDAERYEVVADSSLKKKKKCKRLPRTERRNRVRCVARTGRARGGDERHLAGFYHEKEGG